jgi:hypothetical protein
MTLIAMMEQVIISVISTHMTMLCSCNFLIQIFDLHGTRSLLAIEHKSFDLFIAGDPSVDINNVYLILLPQNCRMCPTRKSNCD